LPDAPIRPPISRAASDDRWARARTSEATTANPRPASPARAASTPALSASRLVWNAMSSMTPMIFEIWSDEAEISPMAETASCTTLPEFSACARASATTALAPLAPSAAELTAAVISARAAAVSSSVAAWCSVRRDRSSAAFTISFTSDRIAVTISPTSWIVSFRPLQVAL
jgi:hypothetical protein